MIKTIVNLAWGWISRNINLPFSKDKLKEQSLDIAYNQGLPALIESLEKMVPHQYKQNLNHNMWQSLKEAASSNDAQELVEKTQTALQNSGQVENLMKKMQ